MEFATEFLGYRQYRNQKKDLEAPHARHTAGTYRPEEQDQTPSLRHPNKQAMLSSVHRIKKRH